MKLAYRKKAHIPIEKLTEYILSETHTVGRLKAKFFRAAGFDQSNVMRDFTSYELDAATRRFMVEENSAACVEAERFAVVDRDPVAIELRDAVR